MIKIVHAQYSGDYCIYLEFSDGTAGTSDFKQLLFSYETTLTVPLRDLVQFKKFFLQSGALCWKNGLELDPLAIYRDIEQAGMLCQIKNAA